MNTIGDRIRTRREELGLSQDDLARKTGYKSRSSINKIEVGNQGLTQSKIKAFANALETTVSYILDTPEPVSKSSKAHRIPVFGKVAAGLPIEMVEDIIDYEEIPATWGDPSDFFCLQIKGDSMKPKIEEGDVVVVHKQADADTGSVVIASINGEEATCKKLRKTDNGIFLMPTNNDYEPMFFSNDEIELLPVKILGKVIELRAKF